MSELLYPNCPECSRKLRGVPRMKHATIEVRRTCQRCGRRWRLLVKPTRVRESYQIHTVDIWPGKRGA